MFFANIVNSLNKKKSETDDEELLQSLHARLNCVKNIVDLPAVDESSSSLTIESVFKEKIVSLLVLFYLIKSY